MDLSPNSPLFKSTLQMDLIGAKPELFFGPAVGACLRAQVGGFLSTEPRKRDFRYLDVFVERGLSFGSPIEHLACFFLN